MGDKRRFHIELGNSTRGPLGLAAAVEAHSRQEARDILRDVIPERIEVGPYQGEKYGPDDVVYIEVFTNHEKIRLHHVAEWEEE